MVALKTIKGDDTFGDGDRSHWVRQWCEGQRFFQHSVKPVFASWGRRGDGIVFVGFGETQEVATKNLDSFLDPACRCGLQCHGIDPECTVHREWLEKYE